MYTSAHHSNSNRLIIGKDYLKFLYEVRHLPLLIRLDRGTETTTLATMHSSIHDSPDFVIYGASTSDTIKRWWKELHERLELYFKRQLKCLLDSRLYNPHDLLDRKLLFYIYEPIISRQCELCVDYWNSHRIHAQSDTMLPAGVPNHMFEFP